MVHENYVAVFMCILILLESTTCLDNGLARTPPMGFLSWQRYGCTIDCARYPSQCISEWLFRSITDLMVSEGYAELGYEYVIIDDCWLASTRDRNGRLQPDPDRFPSGIKALADYIHSKGLKFGIYEDYGTRTCAGYPGIINHMETDAKTFAEWEVDYIKVDGCNADPNTMDEGYTMFGRYLNETGRPMVYSCSWPVYQEFTGIKPNYKLIAEVCNLWRNYGDIDDSWATVVSIMDYFAEQQDQMVKHAAPGHWNDPDMLVIGNSGMSVAQAQAQMAVWSILAAPLLMSTDLANISPHFKAILQNKRVISVNQDPLGIQGQKVLSNNNIDVWIRPISPKIKQYYSYAVAFVKRFDDNSPDQYTFIISALGLSNPNGYNMSDLFDNAHSEKVRMPSSSLDIVLNSSGVVFLKLTALP